jgi:hypothetical protein
VGKRRGFPPDRTFGRLPVTALAPFRPLLAAALATAILTAAAAAQQTPPPVSQPPADSSTTTDQNGTPIKKPMRRCTHEQATS